MQRRQPMWVRIAPKIGLSQSKPTRSRLGRGRSHSCRPYCPFLAAVACRCLASSQWHCAHAAAPCPHAASCCCMPREFSRRSTCWTWVAYIYTIRYKLPRARKLPTRGMAPADGRCCLLPLARPGTRSRDAPRCVTVTVPPRRGFTRAVDLWLRAESHSSPGNDKPREAQGHARLATFSLAAESHAELAPSPRRSTRLCCRTGAVCGRQ
eukprot:COSAG06_NODE_2800_length_6269_cov_4.539546_3_plen_209_part_00